MVRESIFTYITKYTGMTGLTFFVTGGGISYYFDVILQGTEPRNIILPNIIYVLGMFLYFLFLIVDFMAGVNVARHEYYQKYKDRNKWAFFNFSLIYKTLIKFLGVSMFGLVLCLATIFVEVLEFNWLFKTMLTAQGTTILIACLFEVYSVGVNHEKRWGYKPRFFKFFDSILSIFEKGIINKFEKLINSNKEDDNTEENGKDIE